MSLKRWKDGIGSKYHDAKVHREWDHSGAYANRSLSIENAQASEVLLAYAMNGEALPIADGYPLRVIVSGWCRGIRQMAYGD